MSARLLATIICLWIAGPRIGRAEPATPPGRELVVYLKADSDGSSPSVSEMTHEAETLMAAAGYSITWRDLGGADRDVRDAFLAVIELRGSCEAPEPTESVKALPGGASLASTAVADGKVL